MFFLVCILQSLQQVFFIFTPNIHWTQIQTPIHFCHSLLTFVATRGPTSFSFAFSQPFICNGSFQIHAVHSLDQSVDAIQFLALCSSIFGYQLPTLFFLFSTPFPFLYIFSNSHQMFIGHGVDSSTLLPPIGNNCGH